MREQLATKLMKIHDEWNATVEVPGGFLTRSRNEVWGQVADECIRQMEWARRPGLEALEIVQGADEHDGQYDGCSLCSYHKGWDPADPKWGKYAVHADDCPTGRALRTPLTLAPPEWKP